LLGTIFVVGVFGKKNHFLSLVLVIHEIKIKVTLYIYIYIYIYIMEKRECDKELSILTQSESTWAITLQKLYSEVGLVTDVSFLLLHVTQKKNKIK
jgi:hypothetical protein